MKLTCMGRGQLGEKRPAVDTTDLALKVAGEYHVGCCLLASKMTRKWRFGCIYRGYVDVGCYGISGSGTWALCMA